MVVRADAKEMQPAHAPDAPDAPVAPVVIQLDAYDDHHKAIEALALARFLSGREPVSRKVSISRVRADARLLPDGTEPVLIAQDSSETRVLAHGDGWTISAVPWDDGSAEVTVTATDRVLLEDVLRRATDGAAEPAPTSESTVEMGFWYLTNCGARRAARRISVREWEGIRRNYGAGVASALSRLMVLEPGTMSGRLLMLHGPPGTGKTSALRALAYAWRGWCEVDYVVDPERLLREPGYLMTVATGHEADDRDKWRLVLLEDCDELIRSDAKPSAGQSLARLLNLTDGLLGQGLRLLVAITTNEPLAKLHPAVVRPGRCIAQIEVGRLTRAEARAWLAAAAGLRGPNAVPGLRGPNAVPDLHGPNAVTGLRGPNAVTVPASFDAEGATLAELFALLGELTTVEERAPATAGVGVYL